MTSARLTRDQSRRRWRELQDLIWAWDPVGVSDVADWPRDEYDCLVGSLLRRLEQGQGPKEIAAFLEREITDHFGLEPHHYDFDHVATEARRWFVEMWEGTLV